jgi:hypothetical protein
MMGDWAKIVVESELIGEQIGRKLVKLIPPPADIKLVQTFNIPDPLQSRTVSAGKREEVYRFDLPKDCIGFIGMLGNLYYYGDYLYFWVDGRLVESPCIERILADINSPLIVEPWFRMSFYENVRWEVQNNDKTDHAYSILVGGFYIRKEDLPLLFRLTGVR